MDKNRKSESPEPQGTNDGKRSRSPEQKETKENPSGVGAKEKSFDLIREEKNLYRQISREYKERLQKNREDANQDKEVSGGSPLRDYLIDKIRVTKDTEAALTMQHDLMTLRSRSMGDALLQHVVTPTQQAIKSEILKTQRKLYISNLSERSLPLAWQQKIKGESEPIQQELTYLNNIRRKMSVEGTEEVAKKLSSRQQDLRQQVELKQRQLNDKGSSELKDEAGQIARELTYLDRIGSELSKKEPKDIADKISSRQQDLHLQMEQALNNLRSLEADYSISQHVFDFFRR